MKDSAGAMQAAAIVAAGAPGPHAGPDPSEGSPVVAIVWTELQQVILTALLHQEGLRLDILFLRQGIRSVEGLTRLASRVVLVPDQTYSVRLLREYQRAFRRLIEPALDGVHPFFFLTWTLEHPLARHIARRGNCMRIGLFEDGTGSYMDEGWFGWRNGWKHVPTKLLLHVALWHVDGLRSISETRAIDGWSLFPSAFPRIPIRNRIVLASEAFRHSLQCVNAAEGDIVSLPEGTIVYLPSAFSDASLMTEDDEIAIHSNAMSKVHARFGDAHSTVVWKVHPRAHPGREAQRLERIQAETGIDVVVLRSPHSIEQIVLENASHRLVVASVASSGLYTLHALALPGIRIVSVKSERLTRLVPRVASLHRFLTGVGVESLE